MRQPTLPSLPSTVGLAACADEPGSDDGAAPLTFSAALVSFVSSGGLA